MKSQYNGLINEIKPTKNSDEDFVQSVIDEITRQVESFGPSTGFYDFNAKMKNLNIMNEKKFTPLSFEENTKKKFIPFDYSVWQKNPIDIWFKRAEDYLQIKEIVRLQGPKHYNIIAYCSWSDSLIRVNDFGVSINGSTVLFVEKPQVFYILVKNTSGISLYHKTFNDKTSAKEFVDEMKFENFLIKTEEELWGE